MLSRFHPIPERHGQTDRHNCYIDIVIKNVNHLVLRYCCCSAVFAMMFVCFELSNNVRSFVRILATSVIRAGGRLCDNIRQVAHLAAWSVGRG